MNRTVLVLMMAVTVEALIEYAKTFGKAILEKQWKTAATQAGAVALGVSLCFSAGADFYAALGVRVTIVEYMPRMMPLEDEEVSKTMERAFRKLRAAVMTSTTVKSVRVNAEGRCEVEIEGKKGPETLTADIVLSAVGIKSNIEGIGLEELGIAVERDKVLVDQFYRTNVPGVYAIGDIVGGPALAHVASARISIIW